MKTYADQCLERAEKATVEPWKLEFRHLIGPEIYRDCGDKIRFAYSEDAQFIAHARTDVPELARRLKKACSFIRDLHNKINSLNEDGLKITSVNSTIDKLADELEAPLGEK